MQKLAVENLSRWFLENGRDLPWRDRPSPYAVWVSEVMLQQTQVSVVIPYFERWMRQFPTIKALAEAPIEAVLKAWEGLGYYSRARNLHEGARFVAAHYQGRLPETAEELKTIKGVGDYTVGAILSFAFHRKAAAVDGNVLRVLARFYGISDDISKSSVQKKFRSLAQELLPENEPWVVSEALIELGATVCMKTPECSKCPLRGSCRAYAEGRQRELPHKSTKVTVEALCRFVAVVTCRERTLVACRSHGNIMAGLYEFPYFEGAMPHDPVDIQKRKLGMLLKEEFGISPYWRRVLPEVRHSFTRYRVLLLPHHFEVKERKEIEGYEWLSSQEMDARPFSSGHKRVLLALATVP